MQVIFDLPDEVVTQIQPFHNQLPQILELGLREFNAIAQSGFSLEFRLRKRERQPRRSVSYRRGRE